MKEKFIKSTIILVIGGLLTKILGMLIRIVMARTIGIEGLGLYMIVMPTFSLFITIATLSLPVAISKLVSEDNKNNKKIVLGIMPIALTFDFILIAIIILLAPFIANNLLQNNNLYYPILAISITLPFITISSIARGYFFGKQKMFPHVFSNIMEQIIRIIVIVLMTPYLLQKGITYAVTGLILVNVISELTSIFVLFFFLPKNFKIKRTDIKPDITYVKDIFSISIPTTLGRLTSSIGLFLEPIIITFVFLSLGYSSSYITSEYGIITGYVFPMVMMPSFLTGAISSALLPVISNNYAKKNYQEIKRKIKQAIFYSLLIGIPCTLFLFFCPKFSLNLIYKTDLGTNYLKYASLIFFISYILGPLSSVLQAINKSKTIFISNLIGVILKTLTLFFLSYLDINMSALLISYFISFLYITIHQIIVIKKVL